LFRNLELDSAEQSLLFGLGIGDSSVSVYVLTEIDIRTSKTLKPITVAAYIEILHRRAAPPTHTGLRDRALLGVLAYTFARIGAVVNLKVEDYYPSGKRFLLRFKEKGGKEKELPVHTSSKSSWTSTLKQAA
jgi:site-specific recombinase XerD